MIRTKKKSRKYRGDSTHGWGARKKHRGAGNRGGRGMAGTGKRRGTKEPTLMNLYKKKPIGKKGMLVKRDSKKLKTINLYQLDKNIEKLIEKGLAKKDKAKVVVDLKKAGYNKLLGAGNIRNNVEIKVDLFSKKAEEKLKKAKGGIIKP